MTNRKKRLEKGIESLNEQIQFHKEKMRKAAEEGNIELENYYEKEISGLEKTKDKKADMLEKH
jgi:hypothetical protein